MSNYLYFQHEEKSLITRFSLEDNSADGYSINGLEDWQELISRLLQFLSSKEIESSLEPSQTIRMQTINEIAIINEVNFIAFDRENLFDNRSTEELIATLLLLRLRKYRALPKNRCLRLFISHRKSDLKYAVRMAKLAQDNGCAYWLDVLDSNLQSLSTSRFLDKLRPLITACIIEMALINCTHVIACMTPSTRGSLWLAYEYGRITELPGASRKAAAWVHPNLATVDFPEYMFLGECVRNKVDVESWLKAERRYYGKGNCNPDVNDLLSFDPIEELPEQFDDELDRKKLAFESWLQQGMPLLKDLAVSNFQINLKKR